MAPFTFTLAVLAGDYSVPWFFRRVLYVLLAERKLVSLSSILLQATLKRLIMCPCSGKQLSTLSWTGNAIAK